MRPIRLGIIFDQHIRVGGGYQQALNAALMTRELPDDIVEKVYFTTLIENVKTLATYDIEAKYIKISLFDKVHMCLRRLITSFFLLKFIRKIFFYSPFENNLINERIDLVYFLSPSSSARDLEKLNYITTVWDLCHRDEPEFPEVRWNRQFENRENNYRSILPRATAIFVDSPLGKMNVVQRYGVDEERVHVMPFQAAIGTRDTCKESPQDLKIREIYQLDAPYVYYPAQFWAHKNHVYLLEGLRALEKHHGLSIGAIFSGGDQGNLSYVKDYVTELGLSERVRFTGFVRNEEVQALYRQSIALVMPSYFGPTNLPPLEAFSLGVPVLYPDKAGLRDQVGDAALLMDLTDPNSMAEQLKALVEDANLRAKLVDAGRQRLLYYDTQDRLGVMIALIEKFRWRRITWN